MPKVCLTYADKVQRETDERNHKLWCLIDHKKKVYKIKTENIEKALCVSKNGAYYKLKLPANRISVNDLAKLISILHISNEEICEVLRG